MADLGIATSRKQKVFAVKETVEGELKFPSAADFIMPAGPATIKQTPTFKNSDEIKNSLDVVDQFQNALPAGDWTCDMYLRLPDDYSENIQGDILFENMQGSKITSGTVTFSVNTAIGSADTEITADPTSITGDTRLPETGVVEIESEKIYYRGITITFPLITFHNCIRGWDGTTAAAHDGSSSVITGCSLISPWYRQKIGASTFSFWVMTDHFTQGMSGCTVSNGSLGVNNEGASTWKMSGQGMATVWAGTDDVKTSSSSGQKNISVTDSNKFSEGAYITCIHADGTEDNNGGAGYVIESITSATNTLTVDSNLVDTWAVGDEVKGYLPEGITVPNAIESRYTYMWIDDTQGKFQSSDLTFGCPKNYIIDEVGTVHPEGFVEDVRNITSNMNVYFRKDDAKFFELGAIGNTFKLHILFGNMGANVDGLNHDEERKLGISFPKVRSNTPTVNISGATVSLSMPTTCLGVNGEDSCDIVMI